VVNNALDTLYEALDFQSGSLLPTAEEPTHGISEQDWLEKGEWLAAGKRAGADKVFFVESNPVAVFANCDSDLLEEKAKAFNRIWSLARPRILFLASPGEITVLDLAQKPINIAEIRKAGASKRAGLKTLYTLRAIERVAKELQQFHRDNIEAGTVFGDKRFGDLLNRADKALIRDLRTVRSELIRAGLSGEKVRHAHALIGRSIFIRYLEDRGILTEDYFHEVAARNPDWEKCLETQPARAGVDFSERRSFYSRVLEKKEFTYALFKSFARDFNGDMFPNVEHEARTVSQEHLRLIQGLLFGDAGPQSRLFFYAYRFDIVPLDLISSIYEEFYHLSTVEGEKKSKARQDGAFYTPPVLVEFALSRVLSPAELRRKPRVLDPACGSGTFLVESFRRIVRYEWGKRGKRLTFDELKQILRDQIAGIEVHEEAARITAFSLYLAMLHYLEPPAITGQIKLGNRLPNLLVTHGVSTNHYQSILVGNAFDTEAIDADRTLSFRFGKKCADVVVGNPPWGAPGTKSDFAAREREKVMLGWCKLNNKPIGDKEPSQAFLWRSLDFLRDRGRVGMLVSAGVLFKHSTTAEAFREQWMGSVRISEVFNFAQVRSFFFKGAVSPFLLICVENQKQDGFPVKYWSAKKVALLKRTQAVLFSRNDVHLLRDEEFTSNKLWKIYWFGRLADAGFLEKMKSRDSLQDFVDREKSGVGYKLAGREDPADSLSELRSLDTKSFSRYDTLVFGEWPKRVHRSGRQEAYRGKRLLVQRGISREGDANGRIEARYVEENFCFSQSFYGIKLKSSEDWKYKILLGILWSSFSRYYLFLTSTDWGLWHDGMRLDELLELPVVVEEDNPSTSKIIEIVDKLRSYHPPKHDLEHPDGLSEPEINDQRQIWEKELDEAVFELYGLDDEQKGLILDCCEVTLPFFYRPADSLEPERAVENSDVSWMENYARIFARRWNAYLESDMEMRATLHVGSHNNMVALEFFPADKSDPWDLSPKKVSWSNVLDQIGDALPQPMGVSQIVVDGVVHAVSDHAIIVMKRNERRFWTRSLAREDADTTLCKRMLSGESERGGRD
jgi:type I restriction-modification system DNA methylase subunit